MNLNEAKRILKTAGYKLLKEYWDEEPDYDYDPPDGPDPTEYKALIVIDKNNDEVKKELVFGDTIFINKTMDRMWLKNARGEAKEYELIEIVEVDPKDAEIKKLQGQIEELKKVIEDATNSIKSNDEQPRGKRPAISRSNKNDDE